MTELTDKEVSEIGQLTCVSQYPSDTKAACSFLFVYFVNGEEKKLRATISKAHLQDWIEKEEMDAQEVTPMLVVEDIIASGTKAITNNITIYKND